MMRGTVCGNVRTYGSAGALGEQSPRATRSEQSSVGPELASVATPIARTCVADGGVIGFHSVREAGVGQTKLAALDHWNRQ